MGLFFIIIMYTVFHWYDASMESRKPFMHAPSGKWSWKVVLWLNIGFVAGDASCKSSTAENSFIGSLPALLPGTYYKQ